MRTDNVALSAKIIGIVVGLVLGVWIVSMIGQHAATDRVADDRCWVQGGTYKDGTCSFPDKLTPLSAVCMAMKGSYNMVADGKFTCYSSEGRELVMPGLDDKEVVMVGDTIVLRDKK